MARNRRGFQAIPFSAQFTLGALTSGTVIQNNVITWGEDIYVISIDAAWTLVTSDADDGPIEVGWCHGDLSVAEVAEALDAEVSDPDDIIAREHARRPVRAVGVFPGATAASEQLFDGAIRRRKMRFSIGDGHNLNAWARNNAGSDLVAGASIEVTGTIYGRWQR